MPTTPQETEAKMIANLATKTGKTLQEWIAIARASGLQKHGQIVKELKSAHGLTHGYANLVTHYTLRQASGASADSDDLVAAQYSGDKASLKPIYDAVIAAVEGFGGDVEISPKKTCVSLRRSKQFALVQASTKTRVDVGIKLPDTPPGPRLQASGSFNAMVSHRVRLSAPQEVDSELVDWLKAAYKLA